MGILHFSPVEVLATPLAVHAITSLQFFHGKTASRTHPGVLFKPLEVLFKQPLIVLQELYFLLCFDVVLPRTLGALVASPPDKVQAELGIVAPPLTSLAKLAFPMLVGTGASSAGLLELLFGLLIDGPGFIQMPLTALVPILADIFIVMTKRRN